MIRLGTKQQVVGGVDHWPPLHILEHPKKMPKLPKGCEVVAAIDRGEEVELVICETLRDMQKLYHEHGTGNDDHIVWYQKPAPSK